MQHHRRMARIVFGHVFSAQSFGQREIQLQGAALPHARQRVFERKLDFRAVKSALARIQLPLQIFRIKRSFQRSFRAIPHFISANTFGRTCRQLDLYLVKTKIRIHAAQQIDKAPRLVLNLCFGAKNMRVVLHKAAHAHQPVQRAGRLVAMARPKLRDAQRQIAVTLYTLIKNLHVPRTIHRLHRVVALFRLGGEHMIAIVFPVAGFLPQHAVHHHRCTHFVVARVVEQTAHVLLDDLPHRPAVRMPEHHTRRFVLQVKQIKLSAEFAMIAFLSFFEAMQIRFLILFFRPRGTVHARQHFIFGIATPVRAGDFHQLEYFELAG